MCSCDCEDGFLGASWDGLSVDDSSNKAAKRARKGRTRHKMGGARLDMSAPDIRDKVEIVETIGRRQSR